MRILILCHAFNSLTQRLYVELREAGHELSVEFDINDQVALAAVAMFQPELIIAPFLKRPIARAIWTRNICLIVHPGIPGDRGPSSLDWAIINQEQQWGVTVLQANAEMDAGDIWAHAEFTMRDASKASLYHNEVTDAAVAAVFQALARLQQNCSPQPQKDLGKALKGRLRSLMQQADRTIDWSRDDTASVLRKIRSADGFPGVRDHLFDREVFIYDAQEENTLRGEPGEIIARCGGAICRATVDGALWLGHVRDKNTRHPFKLPATRVFAEEVSGLPEIIPDDNSGYRDIWYEQNDEVGYLHFPFYNGAMSVEQCQRLREALLLARQQNTRVIVLMGGPQYWSNGMHLNLIEAADSAADESWRNINAIDDLAQEIICTDSHLTVAALQGNVGAGGVFLARACDEVWARSGVILNPHYKDMGNLYGSEYWTYLLPRYAGEQNARRITRTRLPMGSSEALSLGLISRIVANNRSDFSSALKQQAADLASSADYSIQLGNKNKQRETDEQQKPLQDYRKQELERMHLNFYGFDPSYHVARYNFVYKIPKSRTPLTIAQHRRSVNSERRVI